MQHALRLAARGLGNVAPNPAVGCVIVKNGSVIGMGWTQPGGRPHAETQALAQAGEAAEGATLYVTLEPCSHHGHTPPCTSAIIAAGIREVFVACIDPDPRVSGNGIAVLQAAGITVHTGLCETEAIALNAGFFKKVQEQRPLVALKLATSLDGHMATASGESQWITGKPARDYGHLLRSRHDAILTGSGTVRTDNPALTCRLRGLEQFSPQRVLLDTQCRVSVDCALFNTPSQTLPLTGGGGKEATSRGNNVRLLVVHGMENAAPPNVPDHVEYLPLPTDMHGIDLTNTLHLLAGRGMTRLLVEAGPRLSTAFLKAGLVDRLYWFRAPILLGGDGKSAIDPLDIATLSDAPRWRMEERISLGGDVLEVYGR